MKVTFIGAHGTGKTTLLKGLEDRLLKCGATVQVTPEVPRVVCKNEDDPEFFQRSKNTLLKQMILLIGQPVYETAASKDSDLVMCDRSILDHWAYTRHLFRQKLEESDAERAIDALVKKHCSSYEQIYYLPVEFSAKDDGIRERDDYFQRLIDAEIKLLLDRYNLPFIKITGSIEERVRQVCSHLPINVST